jgi:hypothetical protein
MRSEERMVDRTGKRTQHTTMYHNMTVRGGKRECVGYIAHPPMEGRKEGRK